MKKYCHCVLVLLLIGLFSFSEGKPCPERTKPHNTRCDIYYKCTELTADKHVWVPTLCDEGLVYEHSLTVCVLPPDDWECLIDENAMNKNFNRKSEQNSTITNSSRDADFYIISNGEDENEENSDLNNKYGDGKVEIIIGPDISGEDTDNRENLYDGSGNGGELVELDGFLTAENRESEVNDVSVLSVEENNNTNNNLEKEDKDIEQKEALGETLQTIKIKSEIGVPTTNIDPKLTAHLQRLSQLIDGLKQTYQTSEAKPQDQQTLRPDQLNAFLAHFNIRNKFDSLDPSDSFPEDSTTTTSRPNRTLHYKHEFNTKLEPETKVVLSHTLPHRYASSNYVPANTGGPYSNSQIVVNRPEGSVHFSLPDHHYMEHSEYLAENSPKISEETLKTVLELSKQMIEQQNVPKIIPSSTYFGSPFLQPILLTPHISSPFSTTYVSQQPNSMGFSEQFSGAAYSQNYKYKKTGKTPEYNSNTNDYNANGGDNFETSIAGSAYSNKKPTNTIIHNNIIPVHDSSTSLAEKEVLDTYGQRLVLYQPQNEDRTDLISQYHEDFDAKGAYSSKLYNNEHEESTTKRSTYDSISESSDTYGTTSRPVKVHPTDNSIVQFFTPSEHLSNQNVNNLFSSVDNYGNIPRPMKGQQPTPQNNKLSQDTAENHYSMISQNQLFPQINTNKVLIRPNSQSYDSFENGNKNILNEYHDDNNEVQSQLITYSYGNKNKGGQQAHFPSYTDSILQTSSNSLPSTNNAYMPRPQSNSYSSVSSPNSYYKLGNNKYTSISSPISATYGEGTQLVNMGGNFISLEAFQNAILPLVGNNPAYISSSLNNVELITCAPGIRQPNATDCTRYYVCSRKDGNILSYSCPPYTGFNSDTRICDAKTYAICHPEPIIPIYSVSENKRIQMEAIKALQDAKRYQQQELQVIKAENIANLLEQYKPPSSSLSSKNPLSEQTMFNTYAQHDPLVSQPYGTTTRPQVTTPTIKKRKYYCKVGDKIADQTSIYNYFVCYKNAKGQMKGHKMTCSKGLIFCQKTTMCTLPSKCS